jgi:hypothetical protein
MILHIAEHIFFFEVAYGQDDVPPESAALLRYPPFPHTTTLVAAGEADVSFGRAVFL